MSVYTERAGQFRETIQLMIPERGRGPTGQQITNRWVPGPIRKAKAVLSKSREFEALRVRFAEVEMAFRLRGFVDVEPDYRVHHAGRDLEIIGIETEANRPPIYAQYITLVCRGRA